MSVQSGVVIVSENEIEREGLRSLLTDFSFEVLFGCRCHLDIDPDIMDADDVRMVLINSTSDEETLASCRYVREHWPDCKLVIFAANCHGQTVLDAFGAGVDGYIGKHISVSSLAEMLKLVALGEKMIPAQVFFDLAAIRADHRIDGRHMSVDEAHLSQREIEILHGLVRGDANKIISRNMLITEATVKVHVKSILRKLGVMNRTQAAIWAIDRGLSRPNEPAKNPPPQLRRSVNGASCELAGMNDRI